MKLSSDRTMIDPDFALELVLESAVPRSAVSRPVSEAVGCVLDEPVVADRDYPPFARAMMDGLAVRLQDAGKVVQVIGEVAAGDGPAGE